MGKQEDFESLGRDDDPIAAALGDESVETEALRAKLEEAERKILSQGNLQKRLKDTRAEVTQLQEEIDFLSTIGASEVPKWLTAPPKATKRHAIPVLLLSDLHLDEVVFKDQVRGMNSYNREIAEKRLQATFEGFVTVYRDMMAGYQYDGVIVAVMGDLFSGDIHEELKESNEDTLFGSMEHWLDPIAAGLNMISEEFGKVHCPWVVGNHGRTTRKPRAKFRAQSNADWKMGLDTQRLFKDNKHITFDVSPAADTFVDIYDRSVCITHGDQATGGAGIGGIWPPIKRLVARKQDLYAGQGITFDQVWMGHWHQLVYGDDFVVNGSTKGVDEYSMTMNFGYQDPSQGSMLWTPEHGRTVTAPIFCQDKAAEGW